MSKDIKKEFLPFYYTDLSGVANHMQTMAAEGWKLTYFGNYCQFTRNDPEDVRYDAVILPHRSMDSSAKDGFVKLCEEAGWELAGRNGDVFLFRTTNAGIPNVETDPESEYATVSEQIKKLRRQRTTSIIMYFVFACAFIAMHLFFGKGRSFPDYHIGLAIIHLIAAFFMLLAHIQSISREKSWFAHAKKAMSLSKPIPYFGEKVLATRRRDYWFNTITLGSSILLLSLIFSITVRGEESHLFSSAIIGSALMLALIHIPGKFLIKKSYSEGKGR